jgi:hypothetical protein
MRAERFGSYSTVETFARDVPLVALEVDHAVQPLVAAAAPPRRQLARLLRPPDFLQRLGERLVRLGPS